jgi:glycosyltransferase involved in cell wall biosynthesis
MINGKKIVAVLPAYNAEKTLTKTVQDIPFGIVDGILLVDDKSSDKTVVIAKRLGLEVFLHEKNLGYGGNQKTCYREALKRGADVVVMLHPDYQYDPRLILAMVAPICYGVYDVMLGSRILGGKAIEGGMPRVKYWGNRVLTFFQNLVFRKKLSEYHTGYRAFHRKVLETVPFEENSNDFVFDNQILAQVILFGFDIGEVSCPTRYFPEASSIGWGKGIQYIFGCIWTAFQFLLEKCGIAQFSLFKRRF